MTGLKDDRMQSSGTPGMMGIMTFEFGRRDVSRTSQVPLSRQLADRIEEAIASDELKPGEALPSDKQIGEILSVSRSVIRDAMAQLQRDGLITRRVGAPTIVSEPRRVRRVDAGRFRRELERLDRGEQPSSTAFVDEHEANWPDYTVDVDFRRAKASPADASFLGIAIGDPVQRRIMIKYLKDEPAQVQRSTVPLDIAKGTVLADPDAQPVPGGTLAELVQAGHRPTHVVEEIRARMPTSEERDQLEMIAAEPVFDVTRIFSTDERPVEASRVIVPAATNALHYETSLRSESD